MHAEGHSRTQTNRQGRVFVDTHAHLHQCFSVDTFMNAAVDNMTLAEPEFEGPRSGLLVVVDTEKQSGFQRIVDFEESGASRPERPDGWRAHHTEEESSVCYSKGDFMLAVVAGRQIQTAERLEVLAMGLRSHVGEGQPLEKVISQVVDEGGIAIIPWGFGKWFGERGRYLRSLICRSEKPPFLLGDNGNRVSWLRHPTEFDLAAQNGIHIIPGSDPLPFDRECNTVGRFGFVINEALDPTRPTEFLIGHLRRDDLVVQQFGELENPLRFVQNQVAMQLKRPRGTK